MTQNPYQAPETEMLNLEGKKSSMPKQIKNAIIAVIVSLLVGGVDSLLQVIGITKQDSGFSSFWGFILGVMITGLLLILIVKRYNWARWFFIVSTVLGLILITPVIIAEFSSDYIGAISSVLQAVLQASAVILLLLQPSGQWFKSKARDVEQKKERN